MNRTARGDAALAIAIELAHQYKRGAVTGRELAASAGVPAPFALQALGRLRRGGIVVARKGPAGGFSLSRPPARISAADVIEAVADLQEDRSPKRSSGREATEISAMWANAETAAQRILSGTTLANVAKFSRADKNTSPATRREGNFRI